MVPPHSARQNFHHTLQADPRRWIGTGSRGRSYGSFVFKVLEWWRARRVDTTVGTPAFLFLRRCVSSYRWVPDFRNKNVHVAFLCLSSWCVVDVGAWFPRHLNSMPRPAAMFVFPSNSRQIPDRPATHQIQVSVAFLYLAPCQIISSASRVRYRIRKRPERASPAVHRNSSSFVWHCCAQLSECSRMTLCANMGGYFYCCS